MCKNNAVTESVYAVSSERKHPVILKMLEIVVENGLAQKYKKV